MRQKPDRGFTVGRGNAMVGGDKALAQAIKPHPPIGIDQRLDHIGRGECVGDG